ncbi:NUDIX domain-containing protein [Streptomyces eurocidicus]|uniref:8-oxo-dGTP pyrophosphatase MutT (NUDIX family) n=2 Tax=Streptomyces eurocidicus TaxID=66423 RepID=A0A7W8B9F7_STREU|nr:NUDIX domain-containing protein [Streptomyces eurocidicus]MBB5119245.1 8-oxo-dGTP pyrophosphatase MutT (NUDIX family) [Streptomyces eurocidicus]
MHHHHDRHANTEGARSPFEQDGPPPAGGGPRDRCRETRTSRPARYTCVIDVMVLLHRDDGRVLLLRRAGDVYASGLLAPPGGHLEADETVVDGALREVREEVGLRLDPDELEFCHLVHHRGPRGEARLGVVFTAQRWEGEPRNLEPAKCSALVWADPACPPADCVPYTAAVLTRFVTGALLSTHGWAV